MADAARQILTFEAAGERFAIHADQVSAVMMAPAITRVPQAPAPLLGVANIRGDVLPVLSAGALVGRPGEGAETTVIVLGGGALLGLTVSRIGAMEVLDPVGDHARSVQTRDGVARLVDIEALIEEAFAGGFKNRLARKSHHPAAAASNETGEQDSAFLELVLAEQLYALPLEQVRRVMVTPAEITQLPRTEAVMLGVVSTDAGLLPIVSLAALLGLPSGRGAGRIVDVRLGRQRIGLLVDRVSAVVRAPASALGPVPAILNRGAGEARIEAILKLGEKLVSILAVERIFEEATVSQMLEDETEHKDEGGRVEPQYTGFERFVLFRLGAEVYGLPVACVEEVVRMPATPTRAPRRRRSLRA